MQTSSQWRQLAIGAASSVLLLGAAVGIASCGVPDRVRSSHPVHPGALAERLLQQPGFEWVTYDYPSYRIHAPAGSPLLHRIESLAAEAGRARDSVLRLLGEPELVGEPKLELFIVESRERMRVLAGRPIGGFAEPGELTAAFVANDDYRPFFRHEIMHVYSFARWGATEQGPWISEGLAALAQGRCQNQDIDGIAAGFQQRGEAPAPETMMVDFRSLPELPAYFTAASLLLHVMRHRGSEGIRELWRSAPSAGMQLSYGPLDSIADAWLQNLRTVAPARLDTADLRARGC